MLISDIDLILERGTGSEAGDITLGVSCLGSAVAVGVPNRVCLEQLIPLLPPGWKQIGIERTSGEPVRWQSPMRPETPDESIAHYLASQLEYAIAERSETFVFLHAGVVVVGEEAIILPGESHAGKSTLVAALVKQGAAYYSDEYAVISSEGRVFPFPRQIAMRNDLYYPVGRTDLSHALPEESIVASGCGAAMIVFAKYIPDSVCQLEPLDRTSALIELCQNTVGFRTRPDMSFAYLDRLLDCPRIFKGQRGDADEAASLILTLL